MDRPRRASSPSRAAPWGVLVALAAAMLAPPACRAREGDRCVCADDCKEGLLCVSEGRVLEPGECTPAVGENATPGVCVPEEEAAEGDDGLDQPEVFMDLGAKRDFDPGPPPDPDTDTDTDTDGVTGTTDATATAGTSTGSGSTAGTSTGGTSSGGTSTGDASTTGGTGGTSSGSTTAGT